MFIHFKLELIERKLQFKSLWRWCLYSFLLLLVNGSVCLQNFNSTLGPSSHPQGLIAPMLPICEASSWPSAIRIIPKFQCILLIPSTKISISILLMLSITSKYISLVPLIRSSMEVWCIFCSGQWSRWLLLWTMLHVHNFFT